MDAQSRSPGSRAPVTSTRWVGLSVRRLVAYGLDWSDEPIVVAWTLLWIDPTQSAFRAALALSWVVWVGWQLISQARTGRSFGKSLMGIEVVDFTTGKPLGISRTLWRWLAHGLDTVSIVGWGAALFANRSIADRFTNSTVRPIATHERQETRRR